MRIRKLSYAHRLLVSSEDRVFAAAPVSMDGGRFLGANGIVKFVAAGDVAINLAVMTMTRGVVVPVHDLADNTIDEDELWDIMVPKDEDMSTTAANEQIDMQTDEGNAETATFSEPGIVNPTVVVEGDLWGTNVYDREQIYTFADTSDGFKDATPDTYLPNQVEGVATGKQVAMGDVPGYAMFAVGNPLLTSTTTAIPLIINSREHLMLRYLRSLLFDLWKLLAGLDETGAESPGEFVLQLVRELTEPTVQEETGGAWAVASFNVWSRMEIFTYTPGVYEVDGVLGSG